MVLEVRTELDKIWLKEGDIMNRQFYLIAFRKQFKKAQVFLGNSKKETILHESTEERSQWTNENILAARKTGMIKLK